ncbi:MAG: ABC transporter C-terminal domain-containing protein, partial [Synechococcus sp.]
TGSSTGTTAKPTTNKRKTSPPPARKRRSFKEARELEHLDHELPELEGRKQQLEQAISGNGADIAQLSLELAELISTIERAEERWLELSELDP